MEGRNRGDGGEDGYNSDANYNRTNVISEAEICNF
jgi:hypothetical protein